MIINPYEILSKITSKDGLVIDNFTIKFEENIDIKVKKDSNKYTISFDNSKLYVKVKKIIQLTLKISSIVLEENGGLVIIEHFPDIPFKYDWIKDKLN